MSPVSISVASSVHSRRWSWSDRLSRSVDGGLRVLLSSASNRGLIALGMTHAQIAAHPFLAENTVKVYVKSILRKLGAANRTAAAAHCHRRRGGGSLVHQTDALFR